MGEKTSVVVERNALYQVNQVSAAFAIIQKARVAIRKLFGAQELADRRGERCRDRQYHRDDHEPHHDLDEAFTVAIHENPSALGTNGPLGGGLAADHP